MAGNHLFVFEYKGGFLKADAKYAEDEDAFIDDIQLKFGKGEDGGLTQLAKKIGQVFSSDLRKRRSITGVDSNRASVVVPVLIVQDTFVSSEIVHPFLYEVFGSLKRKQDFDRRITVVGPVTLSIGDVEMLRPYLKNGKISFRECIMSRISLGLMKHLSFHDFFRDFLARHEIDRMWDEDARKRFRSVMDRVSRRFFNKAFVRS